MMEYDENDFLMLSGIQHYAFCPRQWALIHIEQQWEENYFTIDGMIMHENAHNQEKTEKRKNLLITRGMPIFSRTLGIRGVCDVVEFHRNEQGVTLQNYAGLYLPVPVEYKRGKPKTHDADELQLCAQAMCLEEMLLCEIPKGYLYYGEPKKRQEVMYDEELRQKVIASFTKMHELFDKQYTPRVKQTKACRSCSMADVCLPGLNKTVSVERYFEKAMKEGE